MISQKILSETFAVLAGSVSGTTPQECLENLGYNAEDVTSTLITLANELLGINISHENNISLAQVLVVVFAAGAISARKDIADNGV